MKPEILKETSVKIEKILAEIDLLLKILKPKK